MADPLREELEVWVITKDPKSFPSEYRARCWRACENGVVPLPFVMTGVSLAHVRELLPEGLKRIERSRDDAPVIVEKWL
jgi:hypothetical protein